MPPMLLRKHCKRCEKVFLTYETDKEFCTDFCEGKHKYYDHFKLQDPLKKASYFCKCCGEVSRFRRFCSAICRRQHDKNETLRLNHEKFLKEKKKRPRKKVDFEAANLRAERARAFDDSYWRYRVNRDKI